MSNNEEVRVSKLITVTVRDPEIIYFQKKRLGLVHHQIKEAPVECECKLSTSHTPESGLAHYIDMGYSKTQYIAFRNDLKSKGAEKNVSNVPQNSKGEERMPDSL